MGTFPALYHGAYFEPKGIVGRKTLNQSRDHRNMAAD